MQRTLISLEEFMIKKIFKIPYYQRNYAWKKQQLEDLWNDLIFLKENKHHYFGTILVKDVREKKTSGLS